MEQVINAKEFAAILRVSFPVALHILQSGKVRAVKAGRAWKILQSEVERYLRGGVGDGGGGGEKVEGQAAQVS